MSRALVLALALFSLLGAAPAADYPKLKAQAEKLFAEKSYAKAHEAYEAIAKLELPRAEKRWVELRLADTLWRAEAGVPKADHGRYSKAQAALSAIVGAANRSEDRDRVWAEAQESLGDYYWLRPDSRNSSGFSFYQQALDWWGRAPDLELARERYLSIVRRTALPPWLAAYESYGYHGSLPPPYLEGFLKVARADSDKVLGHYLLGMALRHSAGDYETLARIPEELEAALAGGKGAAWYDDALYSYAQHMEQQGRLVQQEGGGWRHEPDYLAALAAYRRLVTEFKKGETRFRDDAQSRIDEITRPSLHLSASGLYLPDSAPQVSLSWRNVKGVDLALYRVDLPRALRLSDQASADLTHAVDLSRAEKVKAWSKPTGDQGKHLPGAEALRWPEKLPAGAYLLEAKAAGVKDVQRELILVTDAVVTVKAMGRQVVAWFTDARRGAPIAGAQAVLWYQWYEDTYRWASLTGKTDADGVAAFTLPRRASAFVAAVALPGRPSFASGSIGHPPDRGSSWKIYAFTDRPAYRPKEKVEWKLVARSHDGSVYATPKDEVLLWEITDPRGAKAFEGKARLDAFGAAWGSLELTEKHPLGEYRVTFRAKDSSHLGSATLFRLEEYKLPEFAVKVSVARDGGKPRVYRLGDKVEAEIQVDYFFGGGVANADVEVLVQQSPYSSYWRPSRSYGWYYEDLYQRPYPDYGRYGGTVVRQETLKTDANGTARITFDTPRGGDLDLQYRIEARVTDSSRREVVGSDVVNVARQRFSVHATPRHLIHRPKEKVTVDFKALDANDQPVEAAGVVTFTRDRWTEVWLDPSGREVAGADLRKQRGRGEFPPEKGWRLKFRGYQHDELEKRSVKTNAQGELELSFVADREGYYGVRWVTDEKGRNAITGGTAVWVASDASTDLGYHSGGLEILVDKDTFAVGQEAPVMLSVPTPDRWVLFAVEGEDLYHWRVVHVTGTVKLLHVAVEDRHVPNVFLDAQMVGDRQRFHDTEQVIVPPTDHFLDLALTADRDTYRPREEASLSVVARDAKGRPAAAQLAVAFVDEAVFSIQQDYAGDPRQFYFGAKRGQRVPTRSTLDWHAFTLPAPEAPEPAGALGFGSVGLRGGGRSGGRTFDFEDDTIEGDLARPDGQFLDSRRKASREEREEVAEMPAARQKSGKKAKDSAPGATGQGGGEVQVRSDFRATALFVASVVTDAAGKATVKAKLPDSLTSWRATARAVGQGSQFGIATATARTRQPLIVRLQAPRFFVVGDLVTVSAVVNNNTAQPLQASAELFAEGVALEGGARSASRTVPANGDTRFDWQVRVPQAGPVKLKTVARSGALSDAMELPFVAWPHGLEKTIAKGGKLKGDEALVTLALPERKPGTTRFTLQVSPSQAVTMLDALPYLVDYPYGCTEQTMSRFLPAVVVAKTLKDLGLSPKDAMRRVFGGIEPSTERQTHPRGERSLEELGAMTDAGLKRLYDFQHSDGGWGWWKDGDSDRWMSAYVVWGLSLAAQAGAKVREDVLARGAGYLDVQLVEEEVNPDRQAWLLHALAVHQARVAQGRMSELQQKAFRQLWGGRDRLNAYSRALLTLAAVGFKKKEEAKILAENLENGAEWDRAEDASVLLRNEPSGKAMGTAHWGRENGWWRWSEGAVETTAFVLRALVAVDPKARLVEPAMNWLVKNRRGAQWSNTRDTAIAVLALNDFLAATGEAAGDVEYTVAVNGKEIAAKKIPRAQILGTPSVFAVDEKLLRDGKNEVRIARKGGGSLYFLASATFFSLEEPIAAAGHEIFVRRRYFKWVGRPTLLQGQVYEREPLDDGATVRSGERVEVVVTLESKNAYEYLIFEDLKPAGFEAVEVKSGKPLYAKEIRAGSIARAVDDKALEGWTDYTGQQRWVHQELRDRKVALFLDKLGQGVWEIRYDLRAEAPGQFHALPVLGQAMYVPEIKCNGDETRVKVLDR